MSTKSEKDKVKQLQEKCQSVLNGLLKDEDNKYCVDCDSKGPRWASWNLGVFLCIRCAGIHRNLGVHISKVKSVNLDTWTPEQVVSLQQMGNSRARAVYEANLPDNFRRPQSDSSLEPFIRAKYEHKKYIAREWVSQPIPKVDWEKEIDEANEKQKRKKQPALDKKQLSAVDVPQLPKPKSASPKTNRVVQGQNVKQPNENKQNADLLGLQSGEDNFTNFVSAKVTPTLKEETKTDTSDPLKSEEENFFNQTIPVEKEKVKLTKDNIMALYANTPTVNNFNMGFSSQGNFPPASSFQNYGAYSQHQSMQPQSGAGQFSQFQQLATNQFSYQQPGTQFTIANQFQGAPVPTQNVQCAPLSNNFQTNSSLTNGGSNFYHSNQIQAVPNGLGHVNQLPAQGLPYTGQPPMMNPFFSQGMNVQQQFTNLQISSKPTNSVPSLTTNFWQ